MTMETLVKGKHSIGVSYIIIMVQQGDEQADIELEKKLSIIILTKGNRKQSGVLGLA